LFFRHGVYYPLHGGGDVGKWHFWMYFHRSLKAVSVAAIISHYVA